MHDNLDGNVVVPNDSNPLDDEESCILTDLEKYKHITELTNDAGIVFIANTIEKRVLACGNINCVLCKLVLEENDKVDAQLCVSVNERRPCKSTVQLCKLTDTAIKSLSQFSSQTNFKQKVYLYVLGNVTMNNLYPIFDFDEDHNDDHKSYIVKHVVDEYTRIKCIY